VRVKERQTLSSQQGKNQPERVFWEDQILSMRIEGAGMADHLKITFTRLVDNDWNKEFWFVVSFIKDYEGKLSSSALRLYAS
jgi:kinetochore protein Spc25